MNAALLWYGNILITRPVASKASSAFVLFGFGDYLCQEMELRIMKKPGGIDVRRILNQSLFGLVAAPYLHLQFCKIIPRMFPGESPVAVIKSILYAVTVSDCIFNYSYFAFMSLCNKNVKTIDNSVNKEIMEKFVPVQLTNMKIWPFLTGFNFFIVPIQFRVLFDNFLSIFWNIYLSYVEYSK